jgi:plastocyanin
MKFPLFAAAATSCGVLAVAGCGGGNKKESSAPATTPPAQTPAKTTAGGGAKALTIDESEFKLAPKDANVGSGAVTVTAKNVGTIAHTLEIEGKGVEKKTANIQPGSSADLKVNLKPGKYEMYCTIPGHKQSGMEGTITVK